ncbi:hypothetical protein BMT55_16510 [Listeria newyorkensis]|uniref:DUF4352 domain-containing protein n=2 Tax=Listeria newyorkensis TaxID=1497681 RepID=A0ABX4XIB5_9LIST|nr:MULTISPECIES: DUF4352 domain-containing protein [Listeria]KGL37360.1 hypothetical protein EP56_17825 [Listeriaceae bacterium FSL A5-0209]KGL37836.1 hypothetical protein EP58_16535 [Listeria newyorkensis]PNP87063.1 hypothetical protein BMT55_16510 [Listeria newyorkensis]RQW66039.1 DUF4352 domain-containing protein [Listeria sp. SHR_NRA_18]WAO20447.1 DUF4352 domain-containing protein [Listeria newyorkensis]
MNKLVALISIIVITSMIALGGCGKASAASDINKEFGTKTLKIKPTKITREKTVSDHKVILKVEVTVKNKSKEAQGIGAGIFSLKNPNHTDYEMHGMKEDVLGHTIAPGQEMKGNIYFEIPVDLEEGWMSYTPEPGHDKTAEWLIVFPKD